jgi:hypothetical protein
MPPWTIMVLVARYVAIPIALRILKFLGWCVVALPLVVGLLLAAVFWNDSVVAQKRREYHDQHPLLRSLYVASTNADGSVSTHIPRAREAFLARIPIGMPADDAFSILSSEDIQCSRTSSEVRRAPICEISKAARDQHVPNWRIRLTMDQSGQLIDADLWIGK